MDQNMGGCKVTEKQTLASVLTELVMDTAEKMHSLTARVNERLASVSRQSSTKEGCETSLAKEPEQWPQLFGDLRINVEKIRDDISRIHSAIDRLEI